MTESDILKQLDEDRGSKIETLNDLLSFLDMKADQSGPISMVLDVDKIEQQIWLDYFNESIHVCYGDTSFDEYSAREKLLSFFYTFSETLSDRSELNSKMILDRNPLETAPKCLKLLKEEFEKFSLNIIDFGTQTGEIKPRPYLTRTYDNILWLSLLFILRFWAKDKSENKERTDVIIDKAVNFTMDIFLPNAMDSGLELLMILMEKNGTSNE